MESLLVVHLLIIHINDECIIILYICIIISLSPMVFKISFLFIEFFNPVYSGTILTLKYYYGICSKVEQSWINKTCGDTAKVFHCS